MASYSSDHWSDYWSQGRLTSLPQDFPANYDGEIAAFWNQAFQSLPADARVLDLCTGNGAVALLASSYAEEQQKPIEITAVDAARIDTGAISARFPDEAGHLQRIKFYSECRVEDLEFPRASFDLVTSQYGIEYCDWQRAALKVSQLLKPGGRLVMLCHSATSDILEYMQGEQRDYEFLEQMDFLGTIEAHLGGTLGFSDFNTALMGIGRSLQQRLAESDSPLLRSVLGMLGNAVRLSEQEMAAHRAQLRAYHAQVQAGYDRLRDMLRVNLALKAEPGWTRVFEGAGLEAVKSEELRYQGQHHAGVYYVFVKPINTKG